MWQLLEAGASGYEHVVFTALFFQLFKKFYYYSYILCIIYNHIKCILYCNIIYIILLYYNNTYILLCSNKIFKNLQNGKLEGKRQMKKRTKSSKCRSPALDLGVRDKDTGHRRSQWPLLAPGSWGTGWGGGRPAGTTASSSWRVGDEGTAGRGDAESGTGHRQAWGPVGHSSSFVTVSQMENQSPPSSYTISSPNPTPLGPVLVGTVSMQILFFFFLF